MPEQCRVGVLKLGCISSTLLVDLILDERATRKDIQVRAFTTGAKLDRESCTSVLSLLVEYSPDFAVVVSPNASLEGPTAVRTHLQEVGIPVLSVSDGPARRAFYKKDASGKRVPVVSEAQGFVLVPADAMIGARKEFLDPVEMAVFNSDVLMVLAATGALRKLQTILDSIVEDVKAGRPPEMPALTLTPEYATEGEFENPYARAKAVAALVIAEQVGSVTRQACFKTEDSRQGTLLAAAAHEMMRTASTLAAEAREFEKSRDTVLRKPHRSGGGVVERRGLLEGPDR